MCRARSRRSALVAVQATSYLRRWLGKRAWRAIHVLSYGLVWGAAIHAGMAGKTDLLIGFHNQSLIHVPIGTAVARSRQLDPGSDLWQAVLGCTGQPQW